MYTKLIRFVVIFINVYGENGRSEIRRMVCLLVLDGESLLTQLTIKHV